MTKKFFLGAAIIAGVGLVVVIVLTLISAVQHRMAEDEGLDLVGAPPWVVVATNVGMLMLFLGLVAMAGVGVQKLLRQMVANRSS